MASASAPTPAAGGTSASMWAKEQAPSRTGWSRTQEPGLSVRGASRGGGPRGRGGRGGRGGKPPNGRAPTQTTPDTGASKKSGPDHDKAKLPQSTSKVPSASSPIVPPSTSSSSQANVPPQRGTNRPRPPRRGSEQRAPRKQSSLGVDTMARAPSNSSTSPSISPNRRKRGHSKAAPPPTVPNPPPRKQSIASEVSSGPADKPAPAPAPAPMKDAPPHLSAKPPPTVEVHTSDIKHDIDALVERVRAVATARPHTPGSHFDWAGDDDDDSLPDLDDWGVTSSLSTTGPITEVADSEPPGVNVISPILQDTLKPLPTLIDVDIPTPSIKLHDVNGNDTTPEPGVTTGSITGDNTPKNGGATPSQAPLKKGVAETVASLDPSSVKADGTTESTLPSHPSLPPKPAFEAKRHNGQVDDIVPRSNPDLAGVAASIHAHRPHSTDPQSKESSPSPVRGAITPGQPFPSSASAPNHLGPRDRRDVFNPSHNRAHTLGRFKPDSHSDTDRPRRNDSYHGRNHSTPPTGTEPARAPHVNRPVISTDALSRLARTLGAAPSRRERDATPVTPAAKAD